MGLTNRCEAANHGIANQSRRTGASRFEVDDGAESSVTADATAVRFAADRGVTHGVLGTVARRRPARVTDGTDSARVVLAYESRLDAAAKGVGALDEAGQACALWQAVEDRAAGVVATGRGFARILWKSAWDSWWVALVSW